MSVQTLHYLSSMFSSSDCWFVFLHYVPVRLNIPSRTDWDQACVAAKRNSLKAGNERNQSNSLRRITTEGHVCICAWGRTERARTRMCVTHPWVVIEPPQGHGSRQSLACSNNNWGNPTTWAGFITTKEAFIGGNPYSADKQCLCDNSLAADMYTYQSVQNPECVCVCLLPQVYKAREVWWRWAPRPVSLAQEESPPAVRWAAVSPGDGSFIWFYRS